MKILYILQDYGFFRKDHNRVGGHIAHIIGVVEAFLSEGHHVTIATYDPVPFWENKNFEYFIYPYKNIPIPFLGGLYRSFHLSLQILRAIKQIRPDMVYLRMSSNIFFFLVRRKYPDLKIVIECNSLLSMGRGYSFFRKILLKKEERFYLKTGDIISVVSDILKEQIVRLFVFVKPDKIIVNPNGVDVYRFRPMPGEEVRQELGLSRKDPVIGFSGNFAPWHRIDLLIRAVQDYPEEIILLLIGTGNPYLLKELSEIAEEKNKNRIVFTGMVPFDKMPEWLAACNILAVTQDSEDNHRSPIKLFEYMAMQKPVIASNVGQIAEVIIDGENGFLFENNSKSITNTIKKVLEHPDMAEKVAEKARKDAKKYYSWQANIRRILQNI